ncbi:hypothetical protein D3C80_1626020 [compost metagenome]
MAQPLQGCNQGVQGQKHCVVAALAIERVLLHGDAQRLGRLSNSAQVVTGGGRERDGITGLVPGHAVEQQRAVTHRAAEYTLDGQTIPRLIQIRPHGDQASAGLEAKQATGRRRNPDRTATIGGMCRRDHAAGDCRRRAAAGATSAAAQVPGVAGRAAK